MLYILHKFENINIVEEHSCRLFWHPHEAQKKTRYMGKCRVFHFKACVNDGGLKSNSPKLKEDSSQLNRELH